MKRALFLVATLPFAAVAAQIPPPPPIVVAPLEQQRLPFDQQRILLAWIPGEARCGSAVVPALAMRRPWTNLVSATTIGLDSVTYRFNIDGSGRALDIHRLGSGNGAFLGDDIAPSLAATRFAAGPDHSGCTMTYVPRRTPLAESPVADLVSYSITPRSGALPREGWARIYGGADCADAPRPAPLVRAFPDFRAVPATPGAKDWSLVGYDLDAAGRPKGVHVVYGSGNAALDAAAAKAVAGSHFTGGQRTGCLYPYWRAPGRLAAPPVPEEDAFRPADATCPKEHGWAVQPTLRFPEAYRRRAIEGWAVVTYDVAPWGEIGNLRVAAAEPSEDFGTQAMAILRSAKVATTQGLVGCVDRVRFKMADESGAPAF